MEGYFNTYNTCTHIIIIYINVIIYININININFIHKINFKNKTLYMCPVLNNLRFLKTMVNTEKYFKQKS